MIGYIGQNIYIMIFKKKPILYFLSCNYRHECDITEWNFLLEAIKTFNYNHTHLQTYSKNNLALYLHLYMMPKFPITFHEKSLNSLGNSAIRYIHGQTK